MVSKRARALLGRWRCLLHFSNHLWGFFFSSFILNTIITTAPTAGYLLRPEQPDEDQHKCGHSCPDDSLHKPEDGLWIVDRTVSKGMNAGGAVHLRILLKHKGFLRQMPTETVIASSDRDAHSGMLSVDSASAAAGSASATVGSASAIAGSALATVGSASAIVGSASAGDDSAKISAAVASAIGSLPQAGLALVTCQQRWCAVSSQHIYQRQYQTVKHSSTASPAHCLPPDPSWAPAGVAPQQPTDRRGCLRGAAGQRGGGGH
ncbi:MAG: hypothetical protein FRX49_00346 [Trebouxia sp. A1-2]|nr:MAG: hypothetical protein FRX49_00346 [Trebouxia sp. A1-2]